MYSCDLYYGDEAFNFGQDEKQQLQQQQSLFQHQHQQQHQQQRHHHQGLLLSDAYPKLQPLLDYTPDLVPNDTPDDDPLTSFDELCMPTSSSSPQVSSYLQYLKEPPASVDYSNVMMPAMSATTSATSTVDDASAAAAAAAVAAACCWPGMDVTANSLLLCPNTLLAPDMTTTPTTATTTTTGIGAGGNDWFCEPPEAYFGSDFCIEPTSISPDDGFHHDPQSGMTREYVSLSDVNSFVAEADSQKHAASIHLSYSTPENLQFLGNEDSLAQLTSFASVPASLTNLAPPPPPPPLPPSHHNHQHHHQHHHHNNSNQNQQPIPPQSPEHDDSDSETVSSTRSTTYWKGDLWKSVYDKAAMKRSRRKKINTKKSDIFSKHKRSSNNNKKSVSRSSPLPASESISTFLARQRLSDDEEQHQTPQPQHPTEEDYDMEEEDDEYVFRGDGQSTSSLRKGRNVDKACNHCKRSHLRCDNMRPCRRCVATGKTGCKDVEHKPRGRPRLNKNQHNVKTRGI